MGRYIPGALSKSDYPGTQLREKQKYTLKIVIELLRVVPSWKANSPAKNKWFFAERFEASSRVNQIYWWEYLILDFPIITPSWNHGSPR